MQIVSVVNINFFRKICNPIYILLIYYDDTMIVTYQSKNVVYFCIVSSESILVDTL